jgi:hypothetical protein
MHRQCGCRNADQCWKGCCCFTNRQKLTWAEQNGVRPPDFVARAAASESPTAQKHSCCQKAVRTKLAGKNSTQSPISALIGALTCFSQLEQWVALGAINLPPQIVFAVELSLSGDVSHAECDTLSPSFAPSPPPPWLA